MDPSDLDPNEALYQFLLALMDEDRTDALAYLEELRAQIEDEALVLPSVDDVVDTIYGEGEEEPDGEGAAELVEAEAEPPVEPVVDVEAPAEPAVTLPPPARRRTTVKS